MIRLDKITKIYDAKVENKKALDEVSLTIDNGEFVAIMGPSGSGKSTLLNIIGCMDSVTDGSYYVDDIEVSPNLFLSSGFCVAIPTGQVSRLHTLIITQPIVTSGAVAKPNSSAPSIAAIATSRPLISLPSVSIITLLRSPFIVSV